MIRLIGSEKFDTTDDALNALKTQASALKVYGGGQAIFNSQTIALFRVQNELHYMEAEDNTLKTISVSGEDAKALLKRLNIG